MPCQDRLGCEALADGSLIAAVADGAGSAARSGRGAEIAVQTTMTSIKDALNEGRTDVPALLLQAAREARAAVLHEAELEGVGARSYASTLLAAVLSSRGDAALQIGDGVIAVKAEDEWCWVFWPQKGEYANTTRFLTDDDAVCQIQVEELRQGVVDIALMSDGLESLALHYTTRTAHSPFLQGIMDPLVQARDQSEVTALSESLEQFLSSERVQARTDDDMSLVLATRRA